jgi:hypothetical protein
MVIKDFSKSDFLHRIEKDFIYSNQDWYHFDSSIWKIFVESPNPANPNEKKADTDIPTRIMDDVTFELNILLNYNNRDIPEPELRIYILFISSPFV